MNANLEIYKAFQEHGFSEEEAKIISEAIGNKDKNTSQEDLLKVEFSLKQEINDVKNDLKQEIQQNRADINLLKWMLGVLIAICVSIAIKVFAII